MINADCNDPSWMAFLIDFDPAVKRSREEPSGAASRTGMRAFMSIEVLSSNAQSFMDGLESFFWAIFWMCVHYVSPAVFKVVQN